VQVDHKSILPPSLAEDRGEDEGMKSPEARGGHGHGSIPTPLDLW
jgi:hypothetical protein